MEKIYLEKETEKKGRVRWSPFHRILLLLLFCLLFTLGLRCLLTWRLEQYRAGQGQETITESTSAVSPEADVIEVNPEETDPYTRFSAELSRLSEEESQLRRSQEGMAERDRERWIAEMWDTELLRLCESAMETMRKSEQESFLEEQKQFRRERRVEARKLVSEGATGLEENIAYEKRYSELTKERCYSILEEYLKTS